MFNKGIPYELILAPEAVGSSGNLAVFNPGFLTRNIVQPTSMSLPSCYPQIGKDRFMVSFDSSRSIVIDHVTNIFVHEQFVR